MMMANRLEDLWKAADDGASSPIGPPTNRSGAEFDELLDAWFRERRNSIEFGILLDESRKLLRRLLADGDCSASVLRRARRLVRAIEGALRAVDADGDGDGD